MKISEILKLTPKKTSALYSDFFENSPFFSNLSVFDLDEFEDGFIDRIKICDYSGGMCHSDGRSRSVEIVFFDEKPVMLYQVVGKNYYHENVHLLDKTFITAVFENYIGSREEFKEVSIDTDVTLEGYGMEYEIKNNILHWEYK